MISKAALVRGRGRRHSYSVGWRSFIAYLTKFHPDTPPVPVAPNIVACFLRYLEVRGHALAYLKQRADAITFMHEESGHVSPCMHALVEAALKREVHKLELVQLEAILTDIPFGKSSRDICERAVALIGHTMQMTAEEISRLNVADLQQAKFEVAQFSSGVRRRDAGTGICVFHALEQWRQVYPISDGPLFPAFSSRQDIEPYTRMTPEMAAAHIERFYGRAGISRANVLSAKERHFQAPRRSSPISRPRSQISG